MNDILINFFMDMETKSEKVKNEILKTNELSQDFGLMLSEKDAQMLERTGREIISETDRIEFGSSITVKIIEKFINSTYISQSDYADIIASLIEVFYVAKDECLDTLNDNEVIDIMFDFFEHQSGGSIEILQSRDLDYLCKIIRYKASRIADPEYYRLMDNYEEGIDHE